MARSIVSPAAPLGHSGPEAQIEPRRLALRGIEFVGVYLRIDCPEPGTVYAPAIIIENITLQMTCTGA
jgi:hypothetical protein